MTNGRILSVDYGDVRTGLAVSDAMGLIANGITTVKAEGDRGLIKKITEVIKPYDNIIRIVVGNPVNMNGSEGARSEKAKAFAAKLEKNLGIPTVMYDERCTTVEAYSVLDETMTFGKKRKGSIDTLSAEIILQEYLDFLKAGK